MHIFLLYNINVSLVFFGGSMAKKFFLHLIMSFVLVVLGAVIAMFAAAIIYCILNVIIIGTFGQYIMPAKVFFWTYVVISALIGLILLSIFIWKRREKLREVLSIYGGYEWVNREKPVKYAQVVCIFIPCLLFAAGLIASIIFGYEKAITYLTEFRNSIPSNEINDAQITVACLLGMSISAIILYIGYFFVLTNRYAKMTCPHCKGVGCVDYSYQNTRSSTGYQTYTSTSEERVGEIRSSGGRKVGIYADVSRSTTYEVTTTRNFYNGVCRFCHGKCQATLTSSKSKKI